MDLQSRHVTACTNSVSLTSIGLAPSIVYTTAMGSDFDKKSKSSRFLQEMCSSTFVAVELLEGAGVPVGSGAAIVLAIGNLSESAS